MNASVETLPFTMKEATARTKREVSMLNRERRDCSGRLEVLQDAGKIIWCVRERARLRCVNLMGKI